MIKYLKDKGIFDIIFTVLILAVAIIGTVTIEKFFFDKTNKTLTKQCLGCFRFISLKKKYVKDILYCSYCGELLASDKPKIKESSMKEIRKLIGTEYIYPESIKIINKYGNPVTLKGTNNEKWLAYFHIGDFTAEINKKNDIIKKIYPGMKGTETVKGSLSAILKKYKEK